MTDSSLQDPSVDPAPGWEAAGRQIAPMLGLLGTVSGMIGAFNKLRGLKSPDAP